MSWEKEVEEIKRRQALAFAYHSCEREAISAISSKRFAKQAFRKEDRSGHRVASKSSCKGSSGYSRPCYGTRRSVSNVALRRRLCPPWLTANSKPSVANAAIT